jgi:hypothetical protein
MRYILTVLLCFYVFTIKAQTTLNTSLKQELDSMLIMDQKYREVLSMDLAAERDSLASVYGVKKENLTKFLWEQQSLIDSLNVIRVEDIIKKYGYPGASLVGAPTNEAVFYIIQHSKVIDKYLPLIKDAAEKKELPFVLYAMMLDRSLMYQDKEQIYGTQGTGFTAKNPQTGNVEMKWVIWPIKDAANVNERRSAAGFEQTVEENAKRLGIVYEEFTLEEVKKMRGR